MAKKSKKQSVPKPVKCHAIVDTTSGSIVEVFMCDSPRYAMRRHMGFHWRDGTTEQMLDKWNEHYAAHRCVVEGKFVRATPKRRRAAR